jgi:AcrR family transcriptional regulator
LAGEVEAPGAPLRTPDRGVARRHAFLQAAREVFLEQGYEAASVNDVVRRAGGSLATLYAQFGNKEGLFLAVTQDQHDRFVRAITPECVDHLTLEDGLEATGERFIRALLMRDNLAFFRVSIGEGRKFPHLVQRYVSSAGADKVRQVVADFLRARAPAIADPDGAGSQFLELMRSRHHYRALADDTYVVTDEELKAFVKAGVQTFLYGVMGARP